MDKLLIFLIFFLFPLLNPYQGFIGTVSAWEVYQYVDKEGIIHFTNVPSDPRYKPRSLSRLPNFPPERYGYWDFHNTIETAAYRHGVDPLLVRAIIKTESDFDPYAVSNKGAQGLMQLMPPTALTLSVQNPFDPVENITGGVRYLRYLLNLFDNNLILALAAYNAGEGSVQKYNTIPPFEETRDYVTKVLKSYKQYLQRGKRKGYTKLLTSQGDMLYTNTPERHGKRRASMPVSD
jgi:soluble lytic murein transglycosylase